MKDNKRSKRTNNAGSSSKRKKTSRREAQPSPRTPPTMTAPTSPPSLHAAAVLPVTNNQIAGLLTLPVALGGAPAMVQQLLQFIDGPNDVVQNHQNHHQHQHNHQDQGEPRRRHKPRRRSDRFSTKRR